LETEAQADEMQGAERRYRPDVPGMVMPLFYNCFSLF
jgi:hypothetical protein